MPNRYTAPEMYRHMLNGRAWVRTLLSWRQIEPKPMVAVSKIEKRKYPLEFRSINDGICTIDADTAVTEYPEDKYWAMGTIVICKDDLHEIWTKQNWGVKSDKDT